MSNSSSKAYFRQLDTLEDPSKYKLGGYCPIEIGEKIHNGRYLIVHRLGHGGNSTVWLALDQSYDNSAPPDPLRPRYVAIKIGTASRSQQEATFLSELQALRQPHDRVESHYIASLLDQFQISGPNGTHCCLVTEFLGPSVANFCRYPRSDLLPLPLARRVAVQCTEALEFLHSHGIVHAGMFHHRLGLLLVEQLTGCIIDLYPGNLAFALTVDTNSWTVEQLYAALGGEPVRIPFEEGYESHDSSYYFPFSDGGPFHRPKYLVATPSVSDLWALCATSEPSIRLIDLSESFRLPFRPGSDPLPGTPKAFAAPELLLKLQNEVTSSIDIWALGCTIYSLLGHDSPIYPFVWPYPSGYLARIAVLTGGKDQMPERFWNAFSEWPGMIDSEERLRKRDPDLNWDCYLRGKYVKRGEKVTPLGAEDKEVLRAVIAAALVVDPAERAPARKILEIMREGWAVLMEPDTSDRDQPRLAHDSLGE